MADYWAVPMACQMVVHWVDPMAGKRADWMVAKKAE